MKNNYKIIFIKLPMSLFPRNIFDQFLSTSSSASIMCEVNNNTGDYDCYFGNVHPHQLLKIGYKKHEKYTREEIENQLHDKLNMQRPTIGKKMVIDSICNDVIIDVYQFGEDIHMVKHSKINN